MTFQQRAGLLENLEDLLLIQVELTSKANRPTGEARTVV
jgi:hypothetical protein